MTTAALQRLRTEAAPRIRFGLCMALAGISLALALAAGQSESLRILLKWLVDPLLHTTSAGSVFLVLVTAAMVFATLGLDALGTLTNRLPDSRVLAAALVASVLAGHAAVLTAQVAYAREVGLPLTLAGYHWLGADNTYTFLLHSHVGKALLAGMDRGIAWLPGVYDTGRAISPRVAAWLSPVSAVALLAGSLAALALLPTVVRRYEYRWAFVWVYAFAVVNCLKTIPDGGPLTYRFLPSFAFLVLLLAARDADHALRLARRAAVPAVLLTVAYLSLWRAVSEDDYGSALNGSLFVLVGLVGPLLVSWRPRKSARRRMRAGALAVMTIYAGAVYAAEASRGTAMLLHPLPAGYRYTVIDLQSLRVTASDAVPAGTIPAELYRRFGDDPLKPRSVFLWEGESGPQGAMSLGVSFLEATGRIETSPAGSPVRILGATRGRDPTRSIVTLRGEDGVVPPYFSDRPTVLSRNNFYVHLHLAAALLRSTGLSEFVMSPLLNVSDLRRFQLWDEQNAAQVSQAQPTR
jgi:hypothetical protein